MHWNGFCARQAFSGPFNGLPGSAIPNWRMTGRRDTYPCHANEEIELRV